MKSVIDQGIYLFIYFSKNKTPWIMYIVIRLYTSIYCANQRDKYDKSMSCNVD